jgi:hypothetical protein
VLGGIGRVPTLRGLGLLSTIEGVMNDHLATLHVLRVRTARAVVALVFMGDKVVHRENVDGG